MGEDESPDLRGYTTGVVNTEKSQNSDRGGIWYAAKRDLKVRIEKSRSIDSI